MVQKGDQEKTNEFMGELLTDLKEDNNLNTNLNSETISSTLNFSNIYLGHDGDRKKVEKSPLDNQEKKKIDLTMHNQIRPTLNQLNEMDINQQTTINLEPNKDCLNENKVGELYDDLILNCYGPLTSDDKSRSFNQLSQSEDLCNYSDFSRPNSTCSSNQSLNSDDFLNLDNDVELDFEQYKDKADLKIQLKFKNIQLKKENFFRAIKLDSKEILLEIEDSENKKYMLQLKPLYDSINEITSSSRINDSSFEFSCKKQILLPWPHLIQKKEKINSFLMNKFELTTNDDADLDGLNYEQSNFNNDYNHDELSEEEHDLFPYSDFYRGRSTVSDISPRSHPHFPSVSMRNRFRQRSSFFDEDKFVTSIMPFRYNSNQQAKVGYTGLDNLGNTCFMNAVLQCLSFTLELRDFFLTEQYKNDLNKENPFGSGGKVAESFNELLDKLWSGESFSFSPAKIKQLISSKMARFDGAQEDSVEFMEIFLDHLHEDLNRVDRTKKIIVDPLPKEEDEMTDNELAKAKWSNHLKFNNSFIVDNFHGQLKSHLQCCVCAKNSLTFDPFPFLSVPLPKPQITFIVFFFSLDYNKKPLKVSITNNQDAKCSVILETISEKFKIRSKNLRIIACEGLADSIVDPNDLVYHYESKDLFVFEMKDEEECNEKVFNFLIKQCRMSNSEKNYLKINNLSNPSYWRCTDCKPEDKPFNLDFLGKPFFVSLSKSELTYKNLCKIIKQRAKHSVDINLFEIKFKEDGEEESSLESIDSNQENISDNKKLDQDANLDEEEDELDDTIIKVAKFKLNGKAVSCVRKVEFKLDEISELNFNIIQCQIKKHKLTDETDLESLFETDDKEKLDFLPFLMQWTDDNRTNIRLRVNSKDLDHSANFQELLNHHYNDKQQSSLEDCLNMFTAKEELSNGEFWHCPQCKKPQKTCKRLTIWRLPSILIIQLKRFSYKQSTRSDKIDNFIDFPLYDLDMKKFCSESNLENLEGNTVYDLYGIVNHYGGACGGHYTATAKTVYKNEEFGWRVFDDHNVNNIDESSIVTNNAYILFYRLKNQSNGEMETE